MRALRWHGKLLVRVEQVPDPTIEDPTDMIVKVKSSGICGSDLHLYGGFIATMKHGDILGHEAFGEVVETGSEVRRFQKGDRVAVPFNISCGVCHYCEKGQYSLCERSNPNAAMAAKVYGDTTAGMFGYSHMFGGFAGGQAEYVRVPFADQIPVKIPEEVSDDDAVMLTDNFPTGYMAAEFCDIHDGDTVAVFGAGAVGQFAARSALLLGAGKVILLDRLDYRLNKAARDGITIVNYERHGDVFDLLRDMTDGIGPDAVIDAVGMEAHGQGLTGAYDTIKQTLKMENDRPTALRWAIQACRKGGTISVPGVYSGYIDKFPMGTFFSKALTMRGGQAPVHKYMAQLLQLILDHKIQPSEVITHRIKLDEAPEYYQIFREKKNDCLKAVIHF